MGHSLVITKRDLIRGVAEHWRSQYYSKARGWSGLRDGSSLAIYERLAAMDAETATPDEVTAIIGNPGWTANVCTMCLDDCGALIELGEPPDYDSSTVKLCASCLRDALRKLEGL